ncbi:AI-2E family transporter [Halogeometricum luteum]|uniref:AI-2E family transporter n=1 Tax=Halogeometricum luteum TaxID=2950537 RepID=A0ABU2G4P3_9EURY|nr:AI-2E family transporter [Halogeometricum sp. S3BR5-2]MDS0295264.1 AI-2E family transporter [Halogeometricum sp. S3BR5-2]
MTEEPENAPSKAPPPEDSSVWRIATTVERGPLDRERVTLWGVAIALLLALLYVGWRYVGTVVMGLFVYYVARPVFRRINARLASRTLAVGATLLAVALPLLVVVGWAFAILANALGDLLDSDALAEAEAFIQPYVGLVAELETFADEVLTDPSRLTDLELGPLLNDAVGSLLAWAGVAFNVGIHGFIVLIIVFYLLRDDYRIARWARNTFVEEDGVLESYLTTVDHDLHNVYFGNILNALMTGLLAAVVYTVLNLFAPTATRIPEAAFLGLLVGVASLVPVIGIKLVTWPVGAYLLGRALWLAPEAVWFPVVFLLVSFVVVDYIPDQLLRPYVSGRTLHVGAVMLAYTLGPLLFGWYGIFLAPLLFVVIFEFGRIVFPWLLAPDPHASFSDRTEGPPESGAETDEERPVDATGDDRPAGVDDRRFPDSTESADPAGGE